MVRFCIVAVALFASAPATAQRAALLAPGETLLEVEAQASVKAVPDQAEFSTGITTQGRTARSAMEANSVVARTLIDAVTAAGVASVDQRTSDLSVRATFRKDKDGDDSDEVTGYRAVNRLTFLVRDIARAPAILDALTNVGATEIECPRFSFRDDVPLRKAARAKAVAAATMQADDYAAALAMRRVRVLRVSERSAGPDGGSDIIVTARRPAAAPIAPGQQETSVTVWIDYALVPRQ